MQELPLDQVIHIGASEAFAKLALAGNERRRRQRERRHGARSPYGAISSTNNQFSHIKVVTKSAEKPLKENNSLSEPVFRKPSLMQEFVSSEWPTDARHNITDSLTNNSQGATFAARARAAELQAARKSTTPSNLLSPTTHEVMTFKSKGKGGRVWKRLDVNEWAPTGEDSPEIPTPTSSMNLNSFATSNDCSSDNLLGSTGNNTLDSDGTLKILSRSQDISRLSLASSSGNVPGYDHLNDYQWKKKAARKYGFLAAEEMEQETESSKWAVDQVDRVYEDDSSASLSALAMATHSKERPNTNTTDSDSRSASYLTQGFQVRNTSLFSDHELSLTANTDQDQFEEPNTTDFRTNTFTCDPDQGSYKHQNMHSSYIAYTQPAHIPPLQSKPPHHYPAVKGTTSAASKAPSTRLRAPSLQSSNTISDNLPLTMALNHHGKENTSERFQPAVSLKPDTQINTSRTVLHDPFAPMEAINVLPHSRYESSDISYTDLYRASQELPWKQRPAKVITPRLATVDDHPVFENWKFTPDGVIEINNERESSAEARRNIDDRFDPNLVPWMHTFLDNAHTQVHGSAHRERPSRRALEDAALMRSNFSDDRPPNYNSMAPIGTKRNANEDTVEDDSSRKDKEWMNMSADTIKDLLLPAFASLRVEQTTRDYFSRWTPAPEWCIDHGPDGDKSFFGGDWGAPPPRVGRDPRYSFRSPAPNNTSSPGGMSSLSNRGGAGFIGSPYSNTHIGSQLATPTGPPSSSSTNLAFNRVNMMNSPSVASGVGPASGVRVNRFEDYGSPIRQAGVRGIPFARTDQRQTDLSFDNDLIGRQHW